ncbi:hypothetical protein ZWY2020_053909 [Hordeum vulgare]|nr:hypothetical protein ZWY2020_053909 [Hordeum vulgare]
MEWTMLHLHSRVLLSPYQKDNVGKQRAILLPSSIHHHQHKNMEHETARLGGWWWSWMRMLQHHCCRNRQRISNPSVALCLFAGDQHDDDTPVELRGHEPRTRTLTPRADHDHRQQQ